MNKGDIKRWADPKQRVEIEGAVKNIKIERFAFLLYCVEGTPWEKWTKNYIASVMRVKALVDYCPRFV